MKTILQTIRESRMMSECGGDGYYKGHWSCGVFVHDTSPERDENAELAEEITKVVDSIPEDVIVKYYKAITKIEELRNKYSNAVSKREYDKRSIEYELTSAERKAIGIDNISKELHQYIYAKRPVFFTGTQTLSVLKMLALMLSEEYSEANMNNPKLEKAFKKLIEVI